MKISDSGIAEGDLEVLSLSATQWRICDLRISKNDATRVIGFIERKQELHEATDIGRGFQWSAFSTIRAAIGHFSDTLHPSAGDHVLARFCMLADSNE